MTRAVEVLVDGGRVSYGSGCLLAPTLVLTAWHVVADGRLEIEHGGVRVPATVLWHGADVALLGVEPLAEVPTPTFGDLARVGVRTVPFDLVGFPRHKRRTVDGVPLRDTDQVTGDIPAGANLKTGVLDLLRDGRPLTVGDQWAGLSGAAVFSRGLLVGVVTEAEEHGPLRAVPVVPLLAAGLRAALADAGVAPAVLPVRRRPLYRRAEEIVAAVPAFEGRAEEYARLASVDGRYSLWEAGPWAGKTTFAAHFATHPPDDVDVVGFFVSRTRGQQTPQFWTAVCDQLAALLDESPPTHPELAFEDLWARACEQVTGQGRRLLLLVDGLDENTQPPPIAFSLPRSVPPGAHVAVFTRPVDALLGDLYDHPLDAASRHVVTSNGLAGELGRRAVAELRDLLTAPDRAARQVLGALAAVGPLAVADLAEICTPMDQGDVRRGLHAAARVVNVVGDSYVIAHEALREEAAAQTDTAAFLRTAVTWAARYVDEGWPDTTPEALVDGYLPLLLTGNRSLTELATEARARFLRARTGDDVAHGRELLAAFDAVVAAEEPDLTTACVLARARTQLEVGCSAYSEDIALGWGLVGEYHRCEYLASFQPYHRRIEVYTAVAEAAAGKEDTERAQHFLNLAVSEANTQPPRGEQLLAVAKAAHRLGEHRTAHRLAEGAVTTAEHGIHRASAETVLAVVHGEPAAIPAGYSAVAPDKVWALCTLGLLDEADAAVPRFGGIDEIRGLLQVAEAAVRAGEPARARRLVREAMREKPLVATGYETSALTAATATLTAAAATLAAAAGDHGYGRELLEVVHGHVRRSGGVDVCAVAEATAAVTGDREQVRHVLDTAFADGAGARAAVAAARLGEKERAVRWLGMTEESARARAVADDRDEWARGHRLSLIAAAAARAGHVETVVSLARSATARRQWYTASRAISGLIDAGAVADATEPAESLRSAGERTDRHHQDAIAAIGSAAANHGDLPLAERMAEALDGSLLYRDKVLADAAVAAATAGAVGESRRLLAGVTGHWLRAKAEARIADLSGDTVSLEVARRSRFDIGVYAALLRTADADLVVATLIDHVLGERHPVHRAIDACVAADLAERAGLPDARTRLLAIAEKAAFTAPVVVDSDLSGVALAMTDVLMAAARHGDDALFDRRLAMAVSLSSEHQPEAVVAAQLNAHAGRFADADAVIADAAESSRFDALLAAARNAVSAEHLDPVQARPWVRRWLLAALRIGLNADLAELLVRFEPALAPLACTWFQSGNSEDR